MTKNKGRSEEFKQVNAKEIQQLNIYKNNTLAAKLIRTDGGCELKYDVDFATQNPLSAITYHTPVQLDSLIFKGVNLPPYFAGLLPEGIRLKALVKKIKTSADDMFSILVSAGNDPVGDIHFSAESSDSEKLLLDFTKLKNDIQKAIPLDSHALAGVQDKVSADRISLPVTIKNKNKSYILKLPSDEFPKIIQNEHICLQIAKACGLSVNKTKVVKDENGVEALLVERFDREWDSKSQKWVRHHQEDACQFLNKYPADKYNLSFQEISEGIKKFSTSPEIEILKLLQLKAFSYLIGNGDLHAKNISLLNDQLSPCYDLVSTVVYGDEKMALMFDGKNQNIKRKNFIDFGKRYGLSELLIESMLDKLLGRFVKNIDKLFVLAQFNQKEKFLRGFFKKRIEHLK